MPQYQIEIFNNEHTYQLRCGDTAFFFPVLSCDNVPLREGKAEWFLRKDNDAEISHGSVDLGNPGEGCSGTLNEPGFLECEYTYTSSEGNVASHKMAVGFNADKIMPSTECPEDFDTFWQGQLARLAQVPARGTETLVHDGVVKRWDVCIDCVDAVPVRGYLSRPAEAMEKGHPILLNCQGAGVRSAHFHMPMQQALQGCLSMDINAHGLANGKENAFYQDIAATRMEGYPRWGLDGSPEEAYFTNMLLRVRRALDYLCEDPLWDQKHVWLMGHSQGALQCFAGAYLDKRVTAIAVGVPAGCDLTGFAIDRVTGWPRPDLLFLEGESTPAAVLATAPYFDNVNFARHLTVPALMSVGFVDATCKPTTVYAAYNAYQGPKQILDKPRMAHEAGADIQQAFLSFLLRQKPQD